jgi:Transposase DDE domain group 1
MPEMSVTDGNQTVVETEHALLVAYGRFAQQVGLPDALEQIPFGMKTLDHSPQEKTVELLAHLLAGGMHVKELAQSAHPLVRDQAVAAAWGQESFASASGVSALLRSVSAETVGALKTTLHQVIDPYRRRVLREISPSWLVIDLDLTGLVVSDQATTYEGADFGYMGEVDGTGRGYQFARAQLAGPKDTFVFGGFLHPGRTVEIHCLEELIALIETEVGRPRRRVELLDGRIQALQERVAEVEAELIRRQKGNIFLRRHVKKWEMEREKLQDQMTQLQTRREALAAENATNRNPRRIILRMDGGFGHAAKLAWLDEQGYDFVARVHNHRVPERLRHEEGLKWEKVSKNGFLAESKETSLGECPYPLRLFVARQWWGDKRPERWSSLVATPSLTAKDWPTRRMGVFYNGRQTIEAGIKEGKSIFASRHLPTRHQEGIAFYQELVLFAQNLLRWFRRQFLGHTLLAAASVKELVRIGANSRAQVFHHPGELSLTFAGDSPWRDITLSFNVRFSYQLWLPALDDWAAIRT